MRLLFLSILFVPLLSFAADEKGGDRSDGGDCEMVLSAVTLGQYMKAIERTEITPAALKRAEDGMIFALVEFTFWRSVGPALAKDPAPLLNAIAHPYMAALGARIRGLDNLSDTFSEDLAAQIEKVTGVKPDLAVLRRELARTAARPEIERPVAMAEFVVQKRPSLEAFFLQANGVYPGGAKLMGGPRQAEMVRLALQYGHTKPGDRILEIGYGTPAVLLGLRAYTSANHLVGVDQRSLTVSQNQWLRQHGVQLVRGLFPEGMTFRRLREQGPYQIIVALDTISLHPGNLRTKADPSRFAHMLRSLLTPSGMLIVLNDFDALPNFTREQAEAAGFEVVRWGIDRDLPPEVRKLMPYPAHDPRGGTMRGFVLRNGPEDSSRAELSKSPR